MRWILFAAAFVASISTAGAQVTVSRTFPGQSGPDSSENAAFSADMMGGVSPKYLVGFLNRGISIRSKADGKELQPPQTLLEFWTAALKNAGAELVGQPYDPRIFFDPLSSRWFATCNSRADAKIRGSMTAHMLIGVSSDDDPRHPWKAVEFDAKVSVDNMKLGLDRNGFYATALASPKVPVIAIPKTDLLWKGRAVPSLAHLNYMDVDVIRLDDKKGSGQEGMVPAFDLNPNKTRGDAMVFVNRYRTEVGGETFIQIRKLTWTSATTATLSEAVNVGLGTHHPVQPTTRAVQPPLPGGLYSPAIGPGEGRVVNAVARHGSVWTIAATEVGDRVGAFWVEIDLATMKTAQHGTLRLPDADILFPSLNVDARGNLGIAFTRTSATEGPSTYVTGRLKADPPNTIRPAVRASEGRFVYLRPETDLTKPDQGTSYSDYSTTVMDPSDPMLFWSYQQVASHDCLPKEANGGRFGTNWVAFRVGGSGKK